MDKIVPETKVPQVIIKTEAQATNYVTSLVEEMKESRVTCDELCRRKGTPVEVLQRMLWIFLNKQGQVVGALNAFRLSGLIPERAYLAFHQSAINSLAPTIVDIRAH